MVVRIPCPHCGASNLEGAEWCGQCYQKLHEDGPASPIDDVPMSIDDVPISTAVASTEVSGWTCSLCGERNAAEVESCAVCGTSFFAGFEPGREPADPGSALAASLVPGLGMARVGMGGEGLIAGILTAFCVIGGATILLSGEPLALVLILCGVGLWAAAGRDAYVVAAADRSSAWLQPRTLTIIAVIVLIVTAVALLRALPEGEAPQ